MDGLLQKNTDIAISAPVLPIGPGISLKPAFYQDLLDHSAPIKFLEIHAENYCCAGGAPHYFLAQLAERYALSIHGVGLSIGAEQPLDTVHLERLKTLLNRYPQAQFSEHLAWSSHGDVCFHDLLPVVYHQQSLNRVITHINQVQDILGRRMLLENPSTYLGFADSTMREADFIHAIIDRTGCGLLLDVNNIYVSATNHQVAPETLLHGLPLHAVGEIHLAGFAEDKDGAGDRLLIDAHDRAVADDVWTLYRSVIRMIGPRPTLIEWDNNVPPLPVVLDQAAKAGAIIKDTHYAG